MLMIRTVEGRLRPTSFFDEVSTLGHLGPEPALSALAPQGVSANDVRPRMIVSRSVMRW